MNIQFWVFRNWVDLRERLDNLWKDHVYAARGPLRIWVSSHIPNTWHHRPFWSYFIQKKQGSLGFLVFSVPLQAQNPGPMVQWLNPWLWHHFCKHLLMHQTGQPLPNPSTLPGWPDENIPCLPGSLLFRAVPGNAQPYFRVRVGPGNEIN